MAEPEPGRLIGGRYALEQLLGSGGMGEVWRARHQSLGTHFAIKLLQGASASNEGTRARFQEEARITAQLRSRNAVQVYDFGVTEDGLPFLVMELLAGETLQDRIDRGRLAPLEVVIILRQAARALDRAHTLGIVHRDFKPANILLSPDEEGAEIAKVVDFGIAKLVGQLELELSDASDPEDESPTLVRANNPVTSFTRTGTLLGTPQYMAPEQVERAKEIGPAADLWAFGVVAYEALVGRPPFEADDMQTLFRNIQNGSYVAPTSANASLPAEVDAWFAIACAHAPERRFTSANEAVRALAAALGVDPGAEAAAAPRAMMPSLVEHRGPPTLDAPPSAPPFPASPLRHERYAMVLEDPATDERLELDLAPPAHSKAPPAPRSVPIPAIPAPSGSGPHGDALATERPRAPRPVTRDEREGPGLPRWAVPAALALVALVAAAAFALLRR